MPDIVSGDYISNEIEEFKEYMLIRDKSDNTILRYLAVIERFLDVHKSSLGSFKRDISKYSDTSRNSCISAVKLYYRFKGVEIDHEILNYVRVSDVKRILINPRLVGEMVARHRPHHRRLKKIFSNKQAWRNYCLLALYAYTGIRNSEALNISVNDIEFMNGRIWIKGIKREHSRFVYPIPKIFRSIETYIEVSGLTGKDKLFPISEQRVSDLIKEMTGYSPRNFRTTFGTEYYRRTRDIKKVQKALGHLSVMSTEPYVFLVDAEENNPSEVGLYDY